MRGWRGGMALCLLASLGLVGSRLSPAQAQGKAAAGAATTSLAPKTATAQPAGKAAGTATVEGTVETKGLPDVTVRLERTPTDPLSPFDGYAATVERDGRFHFEDVAPGDYRLTATSSSEMHGELGSPAPGLPGSVLELKPGEERKGLTLDLFPDPQGFCGRVLDADGKPLRADVEIYGPLFTGNAGEMLKPLSEQPIALTDPDGYFLLQGWLIPDINKRHPRFFLRANGVWYPSTENFAEAIAISAGTLSESGCKAVIEMPRTRCAGHRVTGTVEGKLAAPATAYDVSLYEVNPANVLFREDAQPSIYRNDRIEFDNVCDGTYAIVASNHDTWTWKQDEPVYYASKLFHVEGKDTDVPVSAADQRDIWKLTNTQDMWTQGAPKLPPPAPASIEGSLELVDGMTWKQACPTGISQQLSLQRDDSVYAVNAVLDKQGHFSFDKLEPGAYTLNLGFFAHGAAYVKSFTVDGREIPGTQFTLAAGEAAQVAIEVSNDPAYAAGKARAGDTAPHYLPPGTHPAASVAGRVTGPDAAGATVKLSAERSNSAGAPLYETVAAADGSFRFASVQPGIYKLTTEGERQQYSEYGAKGPGLEGLPIVLDAGQDQEGIELKSYERSTLCGRVIGPGGRPIAGIDVSISGNSFGPSGQTPWTPWTRHTVTNKRGRYEFPEAGPGNFGLWTQEGDRRTWFPSNLQSQDRYAPWVELGAKFSGCVYDIYLRKANGSSFKAHQVTVRVEGKLDASLGDRFYLNLEAADKVFTPEVERVQIKGAGSYVLKGVWPGKYTLTLSGEYGKGTIPCPMPSSICEGYFYHLLASQQVTMGNRDLEGVKVSAGTLPTLDGEVLVDGHRPEESQRIAPVLTGPLTPAGWEQTANVDADGRFTFGSVDAGEYGVGLPQYPPPYESGDSYYIQSVLLNGKPVDGRHFELRLGEAGHLTVKYATDGAAGTLRAASDEPPNDPYRDDCAGLPGNGITFLMIPDPLPADNSGIVEVYSHDTGDTRRRDVSGVPPGSYRVLAVEDFSLSERTMGVFRGPGIAMFSSHAELVQLGALGKPVEVKTNQRFELTLPVETAEMRRLMAELRMAASH